MNYSKSLYKRIFDTKTLRQLLFVVGAVLFISIVNSKTSSALSFDITVPKLENSTSKLESLKNKISEREKTLREKAKKVKEADKKYKQELSTMTEVEKQKLDIKLEMEEIQQKINEAKDSFVNITKYASDASGNSYAAGNCTWYVKSKRPDIGNFWGNANNWINSAKAQGFATGTKAKVGAIGVSFEGWAGHVVYVEKIGKGVVKISEMNYNGLYNTNTRTVPESSFQYIYAMI